ncbi:MAG: hypothetical protein P9L94_05780 [Candidatus Hinthialibacter antarcticus]|nr:hypothetical protein [Candidatus Hinthialibacter antarcticus]
MHRATPPDIPKLKDLGIEKTLASRCQTLAKVSDGVFRRYIDEIREREALSFGAIHRLCRREISGRERPVPTIDEATDNAIMQQASGFTENDLVEFRDVCSFLGVEKGTVSKWMEKGVLRPVFRAARQRERREYNTLLYLRNDVARQALGNPPRQSVFLPPDELNYLLSQPQEYRDGVSTGFNHPDIETDLNGMKDLGEAATAAQMLYDEGVEFGKLLASQML